MKTEAPSVAPVSNVANTLPIQPKLSIGAVNDPLEHEADAMAKKVMNMLVVPGISKTNTGNVQRKCADCEKDEDEKLQRKPLASFIQKKGAESTTKASEGVSNQIRSSRGKGVAMDGDTRSFMENSFGTDFRDVKIHTGNESTQMNRELNAKAFTVGNDIYFNEGEYQPTSDQGKHLLAHELTHTMQQSQTQLVQRTGAAGAKTVDPLCSTYVFTSEKTIIEKKIDDFKAAPDVDKRMDLVRELKWIWRCSTDDEKKEILVKLENTFGKATANAIWKEAGTPLGGYRGMYPAFYGAGKTYLNKLGVKEVEGYDAFSYKPEKSPDSVFHKGSEDTAKIEAPSVAATDILYFYGHQYAQYNSPGVFANGTQTQFVNLDSLQGKGDFSRVKLIISTSCATCCKEATDIFSSIFPNATILGYRKSAPTMGKDVRDSFDKGIQSLKRPLLLDQPVDVNAIIEVWKSVIKKHHPNENERLPGYYQAGVVHYLESGTWKSVSASDGSNSCRKKGSRIDEAVH
ncbi:MAG TPA: DUF4157 domain-containing protein [Chitinophagaceae bacterium]